MPDFLKLMDDVEEILNKIDERHFQIPWTGFTRSDIAFTNEVFHQHINPTTLAENFADESLFSMCPICLRYVEHESRSCMYMTHSCVKEGAFKKYYHTRLWNAFKYRKQRYDHLGNHLDIKEVVEWCTLCGRICKGHQHYKLDKLYDGKKIKIPEQGDFDSGYYFATDCSKHGIGGGGLPEKVARYRAFRETVLLLNKPKFIGKLTLKEALDYLVEEVWQAPLAPKRLLIEDILSEKQYNIKNEQFPPPIMNNNVIGNTPYPNSGVPELLPIVYPNATTTMKNAAELTSGDTENIVQFRHRMANGEINTHSESYQQIALDGLMSFIYSMLANPTSEPDFGKCWQDARVIKEMLPSHARTISCTAKLYPDELLHAVTEATLTDEVRDRYLKIIENYRKAFNKKFGRPLTGGKRKHRTRHRRK